MNGLGTAFRKKSDPRNQKNSENQREIAACEQKTASEKASFCSHTVFSLYFKIREKIVHGAKPLAFSFHFLLRRDKNHYSNLTSKILRMCEQILKKHSRTSPEVQFTEFSLTKQKTRPRTDYEWIGNTILKKIRSKKSKKTVQNQSEIAACEQKTTSEKANFCSSTVFSLYFKFRAKNFSLFCSISCFGVTKITTPIDFKNLENV